MPPAAEAVGVPSGGEAARRLGVPGTREVETAPGMGLGAEGCQARRSARQQELRALLLQPPSPKFCLSPSA